MGMTMSVFMVKVELNEPKNSIIVLYVTYEPTSKRNQEQLLKTEEMTLIYTNIWPFN